MWLKKKILFPLVALYVTSVYAANFQVDGSVRLLSELQGNKELSRSNTVVTAAQVFFRPILRPKLFISDTFILVTEWSLLEPSGLDEFPITGGALATRPPTLLHTIPIRGYPLGLLQTSNRGLIPTPIRINEMYFKWDNDVIVVNVGRQERDWGLGLVYDDARTHPLADFKSVIDTINIVMPLGPELQLEGGYFKSLDALFNTESDDATHLYAQAIHKQAKSKLETGVFFELGLMSSRYAPALVGTTGGARPDGASYFILDGFGTVYPFSNLKLSAEVAYTDGSDPITPFAKTSWDSLSSFAAVLNTELSYPMIRFGVGGGYLAGDSNNTDGANSSFIFAHPNHAVGLILTRTDYGFLATSPTSFHPYEVKPGYYHSGAGLIYAKPHSTFIFGNDWSMNVDIPIAWATTRGSAFATQGSTFMGVEGDVKITHVWDKVLETMLYLAVLVPGTFFDDSTTAITPSVGYMIGLLGSVKF